MSVDDVELVATYRTVLEAHLLRLIEQRTASNSTTPISENECTELLDEISSINAESHPDEPRSKVHWPPIETICREKFMDWVSTIDIYDREFIQVWVLLDVITILSDAELCEPAVCLWLIEELLDSQTISGCRKVFDYLESRGERITAKDFKQKNLILLRSCNELLRRLSRAEDTVFCGRVFIFLFQIFPLGDKSSVNLRGEFHVENVTTFDPTPKKSDDAIKPMEIDTEAGHPVSSDAPTPISTAAAEIDQTQKTGRSTPIARSVKGEPASEPPPDLDALYPKFWSLQSFFSSPTTLFQPAAMATFKEGITETLSCFKSVSNTSPPNTNTTEVKRGMKRKRTNIEDMTNGVSNSSNPTSLSASTFNPKYLTNRDLFDLEIHDIAFRRHILVQALIMLDFLLSLSPTAKLKSEGLTNKSVLYAYNLSEEDAKWCTSMRSSIANYLQQSGSGNEGKFYYRMVDTVLSRDKNWVRWKAENCPSISRPPVDVETYVEAQGTLSKMCEKVYFATPPGASDLQFLTKNEPLESLKRPNERHKLPTMEDYWKAIQGDELDMDFAISEEEKKELEEKKAGRVWRALRASGRRFVLCEEIKDGTNLKALVADDEEQEDQDENEEDDKDDNGQNVKKENGYEASNGNTKEDTEENKREDEVGDDSGITDEKDEVGKASVKAENDDEDAEMADVAAEQGEV